MLEYFWANEMILKYSTANSEGYKEYKSNILDCIKFFNKSKHTEKQKI